MTTDNRDGSTTNKSTDPPVQSSSSAWPPPDDKLSNPLVAVRAAARLFARSLGPLMPMGLMATLVVAVAGLIGAMIIPELMPSSERPVHFAALGVCWLAVVLMFVAPLWVMALQRIHGVWDDDFSFERDPVFSKAVHVMAYGVGVATVIGAVSTGLVTSGFGLVAVGLTVGLGSIVVGFGDLAVVFEDTHVLGGLSRSLELTLHPLRFGYALIVTTLLTPLVVVGNIGINITAGPAVQTILGVSGADAGFGLAAVLLVVSWLLSVAMFVLAVAINYTVFRGLLVLEA